MHMTFQRKLPVPHNVKMEYPLSEKMAQVKAQRDQEIKAVFDGSSDKFILIIGPCSADHSEPVLEYISRLRRIADQVSDKIIMIPRIYTINPEPRAKGIRVCFINQTLMPNLICIRGWWRSENSTWRPLGIMTSPALMKCSTRKTTVIFLMCFPTLLLVPALSKISSTA